MPKPLDRYDLKILATLQNEGRITKLRLAETVGLSPTPCFNRVKRLEEEGYITGYRGQLALQKIVKHVTVFVAITLQSHTPGDFARFERAIREIPEVTEVYSIAGAFDYLLKIIARDIAGYQALIDRMLGSSIGIETYFSYVSLIVTKHTNCPLNALTSEENKVRSKK